jgi:integrase
LALQWLASREERVERKHYLKLSNAMQRATDAWGDRNIKEIGFADLEDFLFVQKRLDGRGDISEKTRSDIRDALHTFWTWLRRRHVVKLHEVPEFPIVPYSLKLGKIVDKETQIQIVEEVKRLTYHFDQKIWLGILWLQTYPRIRPKELWEAKEQDIDLDRGVLFVTKAKEGNHKVVPLIDEDVELARQTMKELPGFPEQHFFRHAQNLNRAKEGDRHGKHYLAKWWNRACKNLGVDGVPLYRGTKHSTVTAMWREEGFSPEEVKKATGHSTNKAFDIYLHADENKIREMFAAGRRHNTVPFKKAEEE